MNPYIPRTSLVVAAVAALALMPTVGAVSLVTDGQTDAQVATPCLIIGAGACVFTCNAGDFINVQIFYTGTVSASCGGGSANCSWGVDHLVSMTPCNSTGSQATSNDVAGICIGTAIIFAICNG